MFAHPYLKKGYFCLKILVIFFAFVVFCHGYIKHSSFNINAKTKNYYNVSPFEQQVFSEHSLSYKLVDNGSSFLQQLFNEHLLSYNIVYNDSLPVCDKSTSLNDAQQNRFNQIPEILQTFRKQIVPFPEGYFDSRGIVLSTGPNQMKYARVNLKMIALSGTKLPVQIWYSSSQVSHEQMIDLLRLAPNLTASACCFTTTECRNVTQVWKLNPNYVYKPRANNLLKPFPFKPASILSSTFSEVLFLDCDSYVVRDPEELFLSDPMYLKFGALFYPDGLKSRQRPAVWKAFNTSCAEDEYEFDSAMILVDKRRVWDGLYMAKLMNDEHGHFYTHVTDGDKDTFRLAFRYLRVKYYLVMTPCSTGSYDGTYFCGYSLCKTDSLSQHIYVNHIHKVKYEGVTYSSEILGYTRIGIGDANNNTFYFRHCQPSRLKISCFNILQESYNKISHKECYNGNVSSKDIEDYQNIWNEPLFSNRSMKNRVLMSKTKNFMPHFYDNFLRIAKDDSL